jgi:hypothetical protein
MSLFAGAVQVDISPRKPLFLVGPGILAGPLG